MLPRLDYRFNDPELLRQALTHRSFSRHNNERLEFLGDGVLNFVVADLLYTERPDDPEGDLSRLRARMVRGDTLAELAKELDLGTHLKLGEGELKSGGHRRRSILADAFEAVIGAIYLDGGFEAARRVLEALCLERIRALPSAESLKDPKTRLQELLQARSLPLPEYELVSERGKDHAKQFLMRCRLPAELGAYEAEDRSRRKAEQAAAALALEALAA